ncbi:MAG: hypothetical protein AB4426_12185 [Xenococcaceae cyanobacterium]
MLRVFIKVVSLSHAVNSMKVEKLICHDQVSNLHQIYPGSANYLGCAEKILITQRVAELEKGMSAIEKKVETQ